MLFLHPVKYLKTTIIVICYSGIHQSTCNMDILKLENVQEIPNRNELEP